MRDKYSLLAIIPARGGSKGLPNKNILHCAGKPLIAWTIEAARDVVEIDEVFVSTDSEQISSVAISAGACVPFLRPEHLATDSSSLVNVLHHVWETFMDAQGKPYDFFVVLQPTSPLRNGSHIAAAIDYYFKRRLTSIDTLASVYEVNAKYGWLMQETVESSGYIKFCFDLPSGNSQRQSLKPYYMPNGAIFITRGEALSGGLYTDNTIPFVMDVEDSIDIDTREEFEQAATILISRNGQSLLSDH